MKAGFGSDSKLCRSEPKLWLSRLHCCPECYNSEANRVLPLPSFRFRHLHCDSAFLSEQLRAPLLSITKRSCKADPLLVELRSDSGFDRYYDPLPRTRSKKTRSSDGDVDASKWTPGPHFFNRSPTPCTLYSPVAELLLQGTSARRIHDGEGMSERPTFSLKSSAADALVDVDQCASFRTEIASRSAVGG